MASTTIENRFIRIEDWEGNRYFPEGTSTGSGGSGGSSSSGSDAQPYDPSTKPSGGSSTTQGSVTTDGNASSGKAIIVSASTSADRNIITAWIEGLKFGKVATSIRLKSSIGSGTGNLLEVNTYYYDVVSGTKTKLSTTNITPNNIGVANKYADVGFISEFTGTYTAAYLFGVEVILKRNTGATVYLDYVSVNKAFTAVTGTSTVIV